MGSNDISKQSGWKQLGPNAISCPGVDYLDLFEVAAMTTNFERVGHDDFWTSIYQPLVMLKSGVVLKLQSHCDEEGKAAAERDVAILIEAIAVRSDAVRLGNVIEKARLSTTT